MSAIGYKQTFQVAAINVRFTPESGQISGLVFRSGFGNGRLIIVAYNVKVTRRNRRDDQMDSVRSMGATE